MGGESHQSLAMQILYREEVPLFLRGEILVSLHPQMQRPPRGGAALQGRGLERSVWEGTMHGRVC